TKDTVKVGDEHTNLDNIGTLAVHGGAMLSIDDEATTSRSVAAINAPTFQIDSSAITRVNDVHFSTITYSNVSQVEIQGGDSPNIFNILQIGVPLTITGGDDQDEINVGAQVNQLEGIGQVTVNGGLVTILNLDDQSNAPSSGDRTGQFSGELARTTSP